MFGGRRKRDGEATRRRIIGLVLANPGMNKSDLRKHMGLAWGTVSYHLRLLQRQSIIQAQPAGREVLLFPLGLEPRHRSWLTLLRDEDSTRLLASLLVTPHRATAELSEELGLSHKVVRKHLARLEEGGLVRRDGVHRPRYSAVSAEEAIWMLQRREGASEAADASFPGEDGGWRLS